MENVLILGSCVSRDIFNFNQKNFNIVAYHARSSFATLANSTELINNTLKNNIGNITSSFQRKMVESDLSMASLKSLQELSVDIILIDLIDERFHLAVLNNYGDVATRSNEFIKTNIKPIRLIDKYSDLYFMKWCLGIDRLYSLLEETNQIHKIKIQKALWTNKIDNGELLVDYSDEIIKKENNKLNRMYDYMHLKFNGNRAE